MALNPLKIIETSRVAPTLESTNSVSIPLIFFDVGWLQAGSVEWLFFYQYPSSTSELLSSLLPFLKSSLSLTLKSYYPLAGNLRRIDGTNDKFAIHYSDGDSVSFTVAECDGRYQELAVEHARKASQLQCLLPQLEKVDGVQPVFAIQATVFPNQGIVIGMTVHHAACDGSSSMQFIHDWASVCRLRGLITPEVPIIDRTLIPDPSDLYSQFYNDFSDFLKNSPDGTVVASAVADDIILATFKLSREQILKLKQLALAKGEERNTSFHCSTIVVAFAYTWVCFIRTKGRESKIASMLFSADLRNKLQPPVPKKYFGNCLASCHAVLETCDLFKQEGFALAAEAIGKDIERMNRDVIKGAENWPKNFFALWTGTFVLSVAGSPKFKVYEVDFGFGRPVKVDIFSVAKTGALAITESREEEGGVEITLGLPKAEMDRFEECFVGCLT
ncbi:hypothetical protein LUZ63_012098 [Rhynchospora breviuscula]|uniref:Uncharacterized protein n=1 Tax=Rhynchospora breviuscula TaxID=2022672 RepID=A0A9Q0HRL9_9POAL|nr:hypothetical protein LUZ63_012098 [Rhynchospora breviuscula]